MTPNIGLGGNMAIESVAVLCSQLKSMLISQQGAKPSRATLNKAFAAYQAERRPRAIEIMNFSSQVTEMHAWVTPLHKLYTNWILPLQADRTIADMMAEMIRRGPKLSFVDTSRFGEGRLPWKDDKDQKKDKGKWWKTGSIVLITMVAVSAVQYYKRDLL